MYIWVVKHNPGMTVRVCHCLEPFFFIYITFVAWLQHISQVFSGSWKAKTVPVSWKSEALYIYTYICTFPGTNKVSESLLSLLRVYLSLLKLHLCISELHHGSLHKPGWFSSGLQWPNVVQL